MKLKVNGVLFGSENPKVLAEFYTSLLGEPSWQDGEWTGYGEQGEIAVGPHSEVKGKNTSPGRIMVMFVVEDVKAEFDRIKGIGAEVVAEPYQPGEAPDMWLATFADPDGNYFQIGSPWKG